MSTGESISMYKNEPFDLRQSLHVIIICELNDSSETILKEKSLAAVLHVFHTTKLSTESKKICLFHSFYVVMFIIPLLFLFIIP